GLIGPVLPNLILGFVNNDMARTAIWNGIFLTVFAAMQFFCSPVIGVLSDRFGRRPVLLLSTLGLGLDYVVMALAPTLGWLFVGRLISGITSSTVPTDNQPSVGDRKSTRLNSSHRTISYAVFCLKKKKKKKTKTKSA